jgi:hypothetical protein
MWEAKIITSAWKSPSSQVGINFCERREDWSADIIISWSGRAIQPKWSLPEN